MTEARRPPGVTTLTSFFDCGGIVREQVIQVANEQIVSIRGYRDPRPLSAGTKIPT